MKAPLLLEIKGNSLDDGPGIRTVLFFKGCSLNCLWCHNPESKNPEAELSITKSSCIGCMKCVKNCPEGAISAPCRLDRNSCTRCFRCTENCPSKALTKAGRSMEIDEIVRKCLSDKPFYDISNGGVTLSGGEPALYAEWMGQLAKTLKENGISVYLETAGNVPYQSLKDQLLPCLSGIYMDIKLIDPEQHRKYCGSDNKQILDNFRELVQDTQKLNIEFLPRTPLIPGITDTDDNLTKIAALYKETGIRKTQLLPYNPTWYPKTEKLGIDAPAELINITKPQDSEKIRHCQKIFQDLGIECQ